MLTSYTPTSTLERRGARNASSNGSSTFFDTFREAAEEQEPNVFPLSARDQLLKLRSEGKDDEASRTRLVVDLIASMTETQALETYQKLTGLMPGSGLDLLLHQSII